MSRVEPEQVRRVARLARLELADDEVERLAGEMERVLSRFAELEAAERGAEEGSGQLRPGDAAGSEAEEERGLRPDRPDADGLARGPASLAPEWRDGFFLVPRLEALGGEGAGDAGGGEGG